MNKTTTCVALCALGLILAANARATDVVVSIKPVHSLVAGVMGDTGEPWLMLTGTASPHTYQMRPSEAEALAGADLVVWVGESLETFLDRPIANLGSGAEILTLHEAPGMKLLPGREGGIWSDEDSEHHDDEHMDEHSEHDDEHAERMDDEHEEHGHGHAHGEFDLHIWLDPGNARRIVEVVADALVRVDPLRTETYRANADSMRMRIDELEASLRAQLAPVRERAFIVFHDGYHYFEDAFGLNGMGAIAVDPARPPSARRLAELRGALDEHDVRCVFTEPQFEPDLVQTVIEGSTVGTAPLDPIGADVEPGPDAWFEMMRNLGNSISGCLGDA